MAGLDEKLKQELERCVRCGACLGVCPVYALLGDERVVARGKVRLASRASDEGVDGGTLDCLGDAALMCLKCGRCTASCPNSVDTPAVVRGVRDSRMAGRAPLKTRLAGMVLRDRAMMRFFAGTAGAMAPMIAARMKDRPGLVMRFSAPGEGARRAIPPFPEKGFFAGSGGDVVVEGGGRRYMLFTGCIGDVVRPQASGAVVELCRRAGVSMVAPAAQSCCGLMSFSAGDPEGAREMAAMNAKVFAGSGAAAIVTTCASCATMIREHYPEISEASFGEVLTFSQFWERELKGRLPRSKDAEQRVRLAFHEPCHLGLSLKVKTQPRELLGSLGGAEYVKTSVENDCCGYGGAFNVENYRVSRAIGSRKKPAIQEACVDVLATECAGCVMQMTDLLADTERPVEVITTAEALLRYL